MIFTLFQGHTCIRNINCKLHGLDSRPLYFKSCMVATYIKKIMHVNMISITGVYSREIINVLWVGQVSWIVENFKIGIFSDTINVVNVKLCMVVLLI